MEKVKFCAKFEDTEWHNQDGASGNITQATLGTRDSSKRERCERLVRMLLNRLGRQLPWSQSILKQEVSVRLRGIQQKPQGPRSKVKPKTIAFQPLGMSRVAEPLTETLDIT